LGTTLRDSISREDYEKHLARPIHRLFSTREDMGKIKCLVTTYGVPFKVNGRGPLVGSEERLERLRLLLQQEKDALAALEAEGPAGSDERTKRARRAAQLQVQ
jgi:hypothetical protein